MISSTVRQLAGTATKRRITLPARPYSTPTPYKPEPDPQSGDYPQLPNVSRQYLPPKGWWDVQHRRNFGDTLHDKDELYSMWGPDIPTIPPRTALYQFTLAVLGFVSFGLITKYFLVPTLPAVRREYPVPESLRQLLDIRGELQQESTEEGS